MFSDHNDIKLGINNRKRRKTSVNNWKLNNILLNNAQVKESLKGNKIYM